MSRYKVQKVNAVGLDAEAANLLATVAEACDIPKQKLASILITETLTAHIRAGLYGEEEQPQPQPYYVSPASPERFPSMGPEEEK